MWGAPTPFAEPSLYEVWFTMRPGHDAGDAEKAFELALERLKNELVPTSELLRAKNRLELDFLEELETTAGKAEQIGFYELVAEGAKSLFTRLEDFRAVSAEDVRRVARATFKRSTKSVVHVTPKSVPLGGKE